MMRQSTSYVTSAANSSTQDFALTTIDDYRVRHVKGFFANIATAGVRVGLYIRGQLIAEVDCVRFGASAPLIPVEFDAPAQIQIHAGVTDLAGAAHTNLGIVIQYEVDGPP